MGSKNVQDKELEHTSNSRRKSMENIIHCRRLDWLQKIANIPPNHNLEKFMNNCISYKSPVGHPNLTTRHSFMKSLHFLDSQKNSFFTCLNGEQNQWVKKRGYTGTGTT